MNLELCSYEEKNIIRTYELNNIKWCYIAIHIYLFFVYIDTNGNKGWWGQDTRINVYLDVTWSVLVGRPKTELDKDGTWVDPDPDDDRDDKDSGKDNDLESLDDDPIIFPSVSSLPSLLDLPLVDNSVTDCLTKGKLFKSSSWNPFHDNCHHGPRNELILNELTKLMLIKNIITNIDTIKMADILWSLSVCHDHILTMEGTQLDLKETVKLWRNQNQSLLRLNRFRFS